MTDDRQPFNSPEGEGEENPFQDLINEYNLDNEFDYNKEVFDELANRFGVESVGDLIIPLSDVENVEGVRGNRFVDVVDALIYLYDAGILDFSNVVIFDDGSVGVVIGYEE